MVSNVKLSKALTLHQQLIRNNQNEKTNELIDRQNNKRKFCEVDGQVLIAKRSFEN